MSDLIDRQAAIDCVNRAVTKEVARWAIRELSSAQPERKEGRWIPVKERLPEDDEMVLVSCQAKNGTWTVNRAFYMNGSWHGSGSMSRVTAWMPLPEPYKEG